MKTVNRRCVTAVWVWVVVLAAAAVLCSGASAPAAEPDGANPRADVWRTVRQGESGTTTSHSKGHAVLIQTQGQLWREIRNGPLASISPWLLAGVLAALVLFFLVAGRDRLEEPRTGERINRFSLAERALHWTTAALFVLLALSGLSMLFGRAVLIPVFGQKGFSAYMQIGMWVHNASGPPFIAGVLIEFVVWVKDNIPRPMDFRWFKNLGGMVGKGPRPHAGKVNGGEKAWFWVMVLAGAVVGATGVILDFPIWGQSRQTMQIAHVIHASTAILFLAAAFGHIYIGTIGAEGTFEGMWRGTVDAAWAKQHQDLWYEEKTRERAGREAAS